MDQIYTWKETASLVGINDEIFLKDLSNLITLSRKKGLGLPVSYQKTHYTKSEIEKIKIMLNWWVCLEKYTNIEWRDAFTTRIVQERLINAILAGQSLVFFSIFCPTYKKGVGQFGYQRSIGDNTKQLIESISSFVEESDNLGVKIEMTFYFSDLLLENYNNLVGTGYKEDLGCCYESFLKEVLFWSKGKIKIELLSSIPKCKYLIGEAGVKSNSDVNLEIYERVLNRDKIFYIENLGWNMDMVKKRTNIIFGSYIKLCGIFYELYPSAIMFWTESAFERGLIYRAKTKESIPIVYPKKNESR
ncbi:MAG: hypothetical protein AABW47_02370 [Nanoarchaeota archaeon]